MEIDIAAFPVGRDGHLLAVGTCIVVGFLYIGRIVLKLGSPGIAHILIDGITVTVEFKEAGYGEVHPLAVVITREEEVFGSLVMVFDPQEFPFSFHRQETGGSRFVLLLCQGSRFIGEEGGTWCFTVYTVDSGVQPVRLGVDRFGHSGTG